MKEKINLMELAGKYSDEDKARELLENLRWPEGPICPHCESNEAYKLTPKSGSKTRKGLYKCKKCRKQFTVTVNTIFEGSHIPINKWLIAIHLFCSSKKGISAHQIHRMLGITYKSAWFMFHRIRYAIKQTSLNEKMKGIIEADETYVGGKGKGKRGRGSEKKTPVFSLVQRDGKVKSQPVKNVTGKNLKSIIKENVDKNSVIMTDDFRSYAGLKKDYADHKVINHSKKEYVKGDVHTNTAENYFSLLKRGINGTFHHVSKHHLHRYCNEFDFRYNNRKVDDGMRTAILISKIGGKRLTYN
ncbi:MAG: IS1595 family transposase [Candidatus Aminicenantes bacterium]|nr:IS1595 family transposase [Candidatus Aminicenantes bacterium]